MSQFLRPFVVLVFFVLLQSCGDGGRTEQPDIRIEGAWARAMPLLGGDGTGDTNSAVYLRLRNLGEVDDRLVGGKTSSAARVEIHESFVVDDVMRMRELDGLEVSPRSDVELRPGGIHLMLLGLTEPLLEGEEIDLTLRFHRSGEVFVRAPVRRMGGS